MTVLLLSVAGLVLYLLYERVRIDRWRQQIPQVITVTGTRGKSSVTRMLASVLRADGRKVLAKTTGSSPKMLWPDGHETEIRRRGPASILEQKTLLRHAATQEVDCLVAEVMSIHPENHFVESQQVLKPDIVVITNTWSDHIGAQGTTEKEVTATLCLDIPSTATVVLPDASKSFVVESAADFVDGELVVVEDGLSASIRHRVTELDSAEFSENVDLVCGVAKHLGIADDTVRDGLATVRRDVGAMSIRELRAGDPEKRLILVNAFAANDPTSTLRVLSKAKETLPESSDVVGLMCLRSDRADRTVHWLEWIGESASNPFARIYVTGGHSSIVARKLSFARKLEGGPAQIIMNSIADEVDDGTIVFGIGNFIGTGSLLAEYWSTEGVAYGL
jgi:poly-gamma-glutamate synthase PgsB/CapB